MFTPLNNPPVAAAFLRPARSIALSSAFALLPLAAAVAQTAETETGEKIIVTATRQPTRASEILSDVTVIDREEIERSGQNTIADLLVHQPGIQTSSNGGPGTSTSFYVRGANSDQTKVLVDGIPINSLDGSGSPLRFIPLGNVERIEILRGPAATLYGADALGGVIHIITRRGAPGLKADAFVGYGSHNTRQATAGLSGGNARWRFRVEANDYETDGISASRHASNKDADKDAYRTTGGAVSLSFLPTDQHEFGASYRANKGVAHYDSGNTPADGDYDQRDYFETRQWQVFSKNRFFDGLWKSTLQYGEARDDQENFGWDSWGWPPGETRDLLFTRTRQLSWQNDVRLPLGNLLLAAEHLRQNIRPKADYETNRMTNKALLVGWTAHAGDHSWQLNARNDDHSRFGHETTYSLAYGYQISPAFRARASYGTAFKAPSLYQLYSKYWGAGNPDLNPEQAKNREAALIWERGPHTASATWYLNKVKDLISWGFSGYENIASARLSGVTLAYSGQFDAWRLGATYDWLDAKDEDKDFRLGRRAKNTVGFNLSRDWGKLTTGAEIIAIGSRYDRSYAKTDANKEKLGGYGLTNLTASYALTRDLKLEARLNNVFDKKYETARYFGTDGFNAFIGLRYSPK
ncbi:MAG: TonB-dependent receptor [Zoogloeaceae bacterium]|jgi:vitamin B12 transporter|nr:TonB-dependent receptor [Zoogloeaceae bacterium]